VAKLAGVPAAVIKEARARLKLLERQQAHATGRINQHDLFDAAPTADVQIVEVEVPVASPALEALATLDVDDLTPRQALEQLYQLKALLTT
jgi:DNA mismatch repair protein MutS